MADEHELAPDDPPAQRLPVPREEWQVGALERPVALQWSTRTLTIYSVDEAELDTLNSLSSSLDQTFLGMAGGSLITSVVALLTTPTPLFLALTFFSFIMVAYFLCKTLTERKRANTLVARIKRNPS